MAKTRFLFPIRIVLESRHSFAIGLGAEPAWVPFASRAAQLLLIDRPKIARRIAKALRKDCFHVVVGAPGCGKTTLVKIIGRRIQSKNRTPVLYFDSRRVHDWTSDTVGNIADECDTSFRPDESACLIIDNAHVAFNRNIELIREIETRFPDCMLLVTVTPDLPRYNVVVDDNPILTAIQSPSMHTLLQADDVVDEMIQRLANHDKTTVKEYLPDLGQLSQLCGSNLYYVQILLRVILEEHRQEGSPVKGTPLLQSQGGTDSWKDLLARYFGHRLSTVLDRFGDDGLLALLATSVWSQYEIPVEEGFLVNARSNESRSLGIATAVTQPLVANGELDSHNGMITVPHRAMAEGYVIALRKTAGLDSKLAEILQWRFNIRGPACDNLIHLYLQYGPHSLDLIAKQLCNRGEVLSIIADDQESMDAIVKGMLAAPDLLAATEIFVNFEWQNHKLSQGLMERLLGSMDRVIRLIERESRIAPIMHFIAPMWFVSGDLAKKRGKSITYDYDWKDPLASIAARDIECPFMTPFESFDSYRTAVERKNRESGIDQETLSVQLGILENNPGALVQRTCSCIKSIYYDRPILCAKPTIATHRPGAAILSQIKMNFLVSLLNEEPDVKNVGYALSIIRYFDPQRAATILQQMNHDRLKAKLSNENRTTTCAFCLIVIGMISRNLLPSMEACIQQEVRDFLKEIKWPLDSLEQGLSTFEEPLPTAVSRATCEAEPVCDKHQKLLALLNEAEAARGRNDKGEKLERFLTSFLAAIDGFVVPDDGINLRTNCEELDVVVEIKGRQHHSTFGTFTICECKNWKAPVSWDELSKLREKLAARGCKFGIFVALNGVTSGFREKLKAYLRDGVTIALLTLGDLAELKSDKSPFQILETAFYATIKYVGEE